MSAAPVITLTTDWGQKDVYVALAKAAIYQLIPEVLCMDISHHIAPFNINQTAYILGQAWYLFPKGSVHLIGVDTEASIQQPHIVVVHQGHYFIGTDNGIFSLLFPHQTVQAQEINAYQSSNKFTFSLRDVFIPIAKRLLQKDPLSLFSLPYKQLNQKRAFMPVIDKYSIKTKVIYIDAYHNVICNLRASDFKTNCHQRNYKIILNAECSVSHISTAYSDVKEGAIVALFNSADYLEIAINKGKAAGLLGLQLNDIVHIQLL